MKKKFFIFGSLLAFIFVIFACRDNSPNEEIINNQDYITSFKKSNAYKRHSGFINLNGIANFEKSTKSIINYKGFNIEYIQVPIFKNGNQIAKLEIVKMPNSKYLPNNDEYALNYIDTSELNVSTQQGIVKMYDLNYDNFQHTEIKVNKNKIDVNSIGISKELSEKYAKFRNPNKSKNLTSRHLCDGNGNGDISFGECYKCFQDAIDANGTSQAICDWTGPACKLSTTAACIYISATN